MTDDRKKPLWPWIVALVVGLPVLYVASFGPACWLTGWCELNGDWLLAAYAPIIRTINHGPDWLHNFLTSYSLVGAPKPCGWYVNGDGIITGFRAWR